MDASINLHEEVLLTSPNSEIVTKTNFSAIVTAVVLLILGIATFSFAFLIEKTSMTISMLLLVIGAILVGYGTHCFFHKNKKKIYSPTGSEVKEKILFFDIENKKSLLDCLEKGIFKNHGSIFSNPNGRVRLDTLYSADGKFAAIQLLEFEPYSFYPVSPIYYYKEEQAGDLQTFISKIKR